MEDKKYTPEQVAMLIIALSSVKVDLFGNGRLENERDEKLRMLIKQI